MSNSKKIVSKEKIIRHVTIYTAYLIIVWGFYRFIFKFPDEIEELIVKPLVWLIPVYILTKKEGFGSDSLGITSKNYVSSVYLALGLGIFFAIEGLFVNFVKYEGFNFSSYIGERTLMLALGLSVITAITEEISFRGYVFNRLNFVFNSVTIATLVSSLAWGLIHLPVSIFWFSLSPIGVFGFFLLTTLFGVGAAFIFSKTKNILAPILLHVLWIWPIILFK